MTNSDLKLGVEVFLERELHKKFAKAKIAVLTHQPAVDRKFRPTYEHFYNLFGDRVLFLLSPQHGLFSEKQANMIPSQDEREPLFGLQVYSLYGPRLAPDPELLRDVDVIFVDLVDVGCRVYTYVWTLFTLLKVCQEVERSVVVLDRPNPLGGRVEGPILESEYFSFVGMDCLPMRHGLTIGELSLYFKRKHFPLLNLEVVRMENYSPEKLFPAYGRPWIMPSPNLPNFECAFVYPGMVLLEGTNLSEGRGTTLPFLIFGSPYLKLKIMREILAEEFPPEEWGLSLRPLAFEPTFDKWKGMRCFGFQLHLTDYEKFRPVLFALRLLQLIKRMHQEFEFPHLPYEFERERRPIELLIGRRAILENFDRLLPADLEREISAGLEIYLEEVADLRVYDL